MYTDILGPGKWCPAVPVGERNLERSGHDIVRQGAFRSMEGCQAVFFLKSRLDARLAQWRQRGT